MIVQLRKQSVLNLSPNYDDKPQQNCRPTVKINRSKIVAEPRGQTAAKLSPNRDVKP
jgi:hypothetical protein